MGSWVLEQGAPWLCGVKAYLKLPSLTAYLMLEPRSPAAVVFRRTERGFVREVYESVEFTSDEE
ncbi:MAG: hypothetical protein AB1758_01675 [Candidatus Eremiobacterota bacterium]